MDWAIISETMAHLDTLGSDDLVKELEQLQTSNPTLSERIVELRGGKANAGSFMQTKMPGSAGVGKPSLAKGAKVDVWQISELLGSGGMGEVYRAQRADGLFEQQVALKIAKTKTAAFKQKFDAERQRLAQLEHPNIARIVDGGSAKGGAPYMTMEFVDGQPIDGFVQAKGLNRNARLGLIGKLCAAVAHAHGRLVLHRDIKHENVLINSDGELRLIDFGVASLIEDTTAETASGPLTLAYAAPEQLLGEPVSAATDIFAIGMLAHFLETGSLPKRQSDGGVAIDHAGIDDEDLAAILAKATAFDPADRYASADALGDDLRRFAGGFPVAARPVSAMTRFKKLVMRNKLTSAVSAAALAAAVAGVIGVSVFAVEANNRARAEQIAQKQGLGLVELYETRSKGFSDFVLGIDQESEAGRTLFKALADFEAKVDALPPEQASEAARAYNFLSSFYADIGANSEAGRVARKLADDRFLLDFPTANALSEAALFSQGFVEDAEMLGLLDRSGDFFASEPEVYSFELVINRCSRSRYTRERTDRENCLDLALEYLSENTATSGSGAASNLTIRAYAADEAIALDRFDTATEVATSALKTFSVEGLISNVPEAAFRLQLARIEIKKERWTHAREQLIAARVSISDDPRLAIYETSILRDLALIDNGRGEFSLARENAEKAVSVTEEFFGPNHERVRPAKFQFVKALVGLGETDEAFQLLEQVIEDEQAQGGDADKLAEYKAMMRRLNAS